MKYNQQLDGLRCVAISLVLFEHFAHYFSKFIHAGYYGVDLFFVISGFLITSILLSSRQKMGDSYKTFIFRRILRIFPTYYLLVFALFFAGNAFVQSNLLYLVTYTYNYAIVNSKLPMNPVFHLWSLSVEEQFYLVWPLAILGLRNNLLHLKIFVCCVVAICGAQIAFQIIPSQSKYDYVGIFPRAYSLGIGGIGAIFFKRRPPRLLESKIVEAFALIGICCLLVAPSIFLRIAGPPLSLYLVLKTTYKGFSFSFVNRFLNKRKVAAIGVISYGIYLFHMPLTNYFEIYIFDPYIWSLFPFESMGPLRMLEFHPYFIKLPLYSGLSIFVAYLSFRYIEKPLLRRKDIWFPRTEEKKGNRKMVFAEVL
jgi:peptidoglycan/LPS O-acetylase OafA/YrhL